MKEEFFESIVEEESYQMREKFRKGAIEHQQPLDDIQNTDEAMHEVRDLTFYLHNQKRVMRKILEYIESGDLFEAKELLQKQL